MIRSFDPLWTVVDFRLPQDTKEAKSAARKFLKVLRLRCGGIRRVAVSRGHGAGLICCRLEKATAELGAVLPADAELCLTPVTDKQVEKSRHFWGKRGVLAGEVVVIKNV